MRRSWWWGDPSESEKDQRGVALSSGLLPTFTGLALLVLSTYLFILHPDEFLGLCVWCGEREDRDGALHAAVLCEFAVE